MKATSQRPHGISGSTALKGDPEHKNAALLLLFVELNFSVKVFRVFSTGKTGNKIISFNSFNFTKKETEVLLTDMEFNNISRAP